MSNSNQNPIWPAKPALSIYLHWDGTAGIFCVGPSGQASSGPGGDWHELESANLWLEQAYGVAHGVKHLAEWHARTLLTLHQIPFNKTKVHLEVPYNPTKPVLLTTL